MPEELTPEQKAALAAGGGETPNDDDDDPPGGDLRVALRQERERRREAEAARQEAEAKLTSEEYKQMEALATEYKGLLPHLPAILEKAAAAGQKPTGGGPAADADLVEFAQVMGYTDDEGQPDLVKAKAALDYLDRRAGAQTSKAVAPVSKAVAEGNARQIREKAYLIRDDEGNLYAKKEFIDKVFEKIDPVALMNPENATAALILARGLGGPGGEMELADPTYTAGGGRPPKGGKPDLSEEGKAIAKIRGRKPEDWQALHDDPETTGNWDLE